jgi:hypothetical protein
MFLHFCCSIFFWCEKCGEVRGAESGKSSEVWVLGMVISNLILFFIIRSLKMGDYDNIK